MPTSSVVPEPLPRPAFETFDSNWSDAFCFELMGFDISEHSLRKHRSDLYSSYSSIDQYSTEGVDGNLMKWRDDAISVSLFAPVMLASGELLDASYSGCNCFANRRVRDF